MQKNTILMVGQNNKIKNFLLKNITDIKLDLSKLNQVIEKLVQNPFHYDLLIISHEINKKDKLELIKKIHLCRDLKFLSIIVISEDFNTKIADKYLSIGVRYCIPYPIIDETFAKVVINKSLNDSHKLKHIPKDIYLSNNITHANFKIQSLKEAQALSIFLSKTFPNSKLVTMGIAELLINAIEHGNLKINYNDKSTVHSEENWINFIEEKLLLPENKEKFVFISFEKTKNEIIIKIEDQGDGFNWKKYLNLDHDRLSDYHGRGIFMAKNLAFDKLEYIGKGNIVKITIKI